LRLSKIFIIFFVCLTLLIIYSSQIAAQYNMSDFNLSEHRFSGQEFFDIFGFGLMICFLVFIIPFLIGVVLAIWIYKDANKRGKEGILWAILMIVLTLILNFFGILLITIVWIAIRPPIGGEPRITPSDRRCQNCGRLIPEDALVCPYCAKKFDQYL